MYLQQNKHDVIEGNTTTMVSICIVLANAMSGLERDIVVSLTTTAITVGMYMHTLCAPPS